MSIKARINAVEKKSGLGSNVQIVIFHTVYEDEQGGIDSEYFHAPVGRPGQPESYFCVKSNDDETFEEYEARVESECLKAFGELPRDWKENQS